jgi:hypothetical protein
MIGQHDKVRNDYAATVAGFPGGEPRREKPLYVAAFMPHSGHDRQF